jgi:hypothetical protein
MQIRKNKKKIEGKLKSEAMTKIYKSKHNDWEDIDFLYRNIKCKGRIL